MTEIRPPVAYIVERRKYQQILENADGISVLIGVPGNGKTNLARTEAQLLKERAEKVKYPTPVEEEADVDPYFVPDNRIARAVEIDCLTDTALRDFRPDKNVNFILLDNVTENTRDLVRRLLPKLQHCRVIITTTDATLLPDYAHNTLKIDGLEYSEAKELMVNLSISNGHKEPLVDSEVLSKIYDLLSGSPLGLKVAYAYLSITKKDPHQYLYCLKNGIELGNMIKVTNIFTEKEYTHSLINVLKQSIEAFQNEVQSETCVFEALQVLAFLSKHDIPLEALGRMYDDKAHMVSDDLGVMLEKYCMGDIRKVGGQRVISIHGAIQVALLVGMSDEEKLKALRTAAMLLCHLCHKDNRSVSDFSTQVALMQHSESVLEHIDNQSNIEDTKELNICRIWLLSALAHMCTQTKRLEKGQELLLKAIEVIEDLMGNKYKLLDASLDDIQGIFHQLEQVSNDEGVERFLGSFIQSVRISQSDVKFWAGSDPKLEQDLVSACSLTPVLYKKLVQTGNAIPPDEVIRYFLAELAATVLYTYGRVFLYTKNQSTRGIHKAALETAKLICNYIEAKFNVRLLHTELVDRNGLVSFLLEQHPDNSSPSEAEQAAKACQDILDSAADRFEFGLLKAKQCDSDRALICHREIIKAMTICLRNECDANKERTALNSVVEIENRLNVLREQGVTLHREPTYHLTIGNLLLALGLKEAAMKYFLKACNLEKTHNDSVNHPWLNALIGLQQCKPDKDFLDELSIYIDHLEGFKGTYKNDLQKAYKLFLSVDPNNGDIREKLTTLDNRRRPQRRRSLGFYV